MMKKNASPCLTQIAPYKGLCAESGEKHEPARDIDTAAVDKRYSEGNVVGRPAIQSFVGSLVGMGATKGVFVSTSKFSGEAVEYARHLRERVILIDGRRLAELMIEHSVGVRLNRAIEFKKIDEDYFVEEE